MGHVLVIDADEAFATDIRDSLQAHGLEATTIRDGKAGLDMARINIPDAIVLCVELPKMSGYSICAKLKKDSTLKSVPLVITSSEATQETFEHHKKLKTRAEEYLKKPFEPGDLLALLSAHIPIGDPISGEEVSINADPPETLNDDEAFEAHESAAMDATSEAIDNTIAQLTNEYPPELESSAGIPDDYDHDAEAMTTIGVIPTGSPVKDALHAADLADLRSALVKEQEARARAERERDVAVANEKASAAQAHAISQSQVPTPSGGGREVLGLKKEINAKDREILELKDQLQGKEKQLLEVRDREMELESKVVEAEEAQQRSEQEKSEAVGRSAAAEAKAQELERSSEQTISDLNRRLAETSSREAEIDAALQAAEDERQSLGAQLTQRNTEVQSLRAEVESLKSDVSASVNQIGSLTDKLANEERIAHERGEEATGLRSQVESLSAELEAAQSAVGEAEERLSRAYQKIREDDEIKGKAKKAIEIASALLQEAGYSGELEDEGAGLHP